MSCCPPPKKSPNLASLLSFIAYWSERTRMWRIKWMFLCCLILDSLLPFLLYYPQRRVEEVVKNEIVRWLMSKWTKTKCLIQRMQVGRVGLGWLHGFGRYMKHLFRELNCDHEHVCVPTCTRNTSQRVEIAYWHSSMWKCSHHNIKWAVTHPH